MRCLTAGNGAACSRWLMLAGMVATAVATIVLVHRLKDSVRTPPIPDAGDEVNGM